MYFCIGYSFSIVNNTNEQGKIRNMQITDGDASFQPDNEQIINNDGGNGNLTVNNYQLLICCTSVCIHVGLGFIRFYCEICREV